MIGKPDRRTFLKRILRVAAAAPALGGLAGCEWLSRAPPAKEPPKVIFPPNRYVRRWTGDDCTAAHAALRRLGAAPAAEVELRGNYDVIVVGGGISGATAAYLARAHNVLLLEASDHIGGNGRVLGWGGHLFSAGSAYLMGLEPGDLRSKIYRELGLDRIWRKQPPGGNLALGDDGIQPTALSRRDIAALAAQADALFVKLEARLEGIDIPWHPSTGWTRAQFEAADRQSLRQFLEAEVGTLHPMLARYVDVTCRAAFAASIDELSGYCGLYLLADELNDTYVLPGGNGIVAERMVATLRQHNRFRVETGELVYRVEESDAGVDVWTTGPGGRRQRFRGRTVIVAAPKVVARRVVVGLPQAQADAMARLRYRAYVVANILLKRPVRRDFYDLFNVANGSIAGNHQADPISDVVHAGFAQKMPGDGGVLTVYRPLVREDGGRSLCGADRYAAADDLSFGEAEARTRRDIEPLLFALGLGPDDVFSVALSRWGHGIVFSAPGQLADGTVDLAARPFGRIFFANQDSQGVSAIENAMGSAIRAVIDAGLL